MGIKIGNTDISKIKIASGESPRLPSAYQEVEYIESSGTQWIDTGVYANEDTVVETKWNLVQYNSNVSYDKIYGTYGTNGANCFMLQSNKPENYRIRIVNYDNGMNAYKIDSSSAISTGTDYTTKHSATEFWIDGTLQGTCGSISYTTPTTITIFALHDGNTVTQNVYLKLYYFKIYSGATLVRDFVPCYRISDGEIGLYDLENDVFYTNSGSGVFDKGGNLPNLYKNITKVFLGSTQVRPQISSERPDLDQYSLLGSTTLGFTSIHGIAISGDGTKLYAGPASGAIRQYTLTGGLITGISGVESQSSSIYTRGLYVKPDGSRLYSVSDNSRGYTITMPTAYSLTGSSSSYINITGIVQNNNPVGVWFTPDGNYFFTCRWDNTNKYLYKIPLTTAWDITSYTSIGVTSILLSEGFAYNVAISPTGLKVFAGSENYIYQYNLSTPRDITTATYSGKSLAINGRATFSVTDNGDIFQTPTDSTGNVYQYRAGGWQPGANTLLYMPLNSTDLATDQSGNNVQTNNNGVTFGTYQGVDCGYFDRNNITVTPFAIPADVTVLCRCYNTGYYVSNQDGKIFDTRGNGQQTILYYSNNGNGGYYGYSPGPLVSGDQHQNEWILVCLVVDNLGNATLYTKGANSDTTNMVTGAQAGFTPTTMNVGNEHDDGAPRYFLGGMSELIVESKSWTRQEYLNYFDQTKANYGIS